MKLSEVLKLTKLQNEILVHRLEVPDAICEALGDGVTSYNEEDIYDVVDFLLKDDYLSAKNFSESITYDVLEDCLDGSTVCACAESAGFSDQKISGIQRSGMLLAEKVSELIGKEVDFAVC